MLIWDVVISPKWGFVVKLIEGPRTETGVGDDLVAIITLLSVLGLHLPIPALTDSVLDFLRGLERLERLGERGTNYFWATGKVGK